MPVYKDNKTNTWRAVFRYTDWTGEKKQTQKRGFITQRAAKAWEKEEMLKLQGACNMTFDSFVELYFESLSTKLKFNTINTKKHIFETKILPYFADKKTNEMSRSSLGEIQTIIVAQQLNIPVFYSNDRGSKFLVTKVNSSAFTLEVYDTPEISIKISQNSNTNIEEKYCISMIHNATEDDKKKAKKCIAIVKENYRCTQN